MKKVLLGLMILSLFSMCSKSENNEEVDLRSDEEIALSQLASAFGWSVQRFSRFGCENFDLIGESVATEVYTMSLITNGEYQIRIGIPGGLVITGKWTFIRKVDEDIYEFENTFYTFPESIPPSLESPLLKEGVYRIEFRAIQGSPKDLMTMIYAECTDAIRDGFKWE